MLAFSRHSSICIPYLELLSQSPQLSHEIYRQTICDLALWTNSELGCVTLYLLTY